ncbi:lipid-A-disaccharide synthase [Formivibrio citricus]|uniref:Lipid-A-disaccharide synthase n=1 Tax=Formivibrio citricus TaxID=83765 RepID=A0A1I4X8U8_9NEIS|nr:lipid-A-disaccharide synthase [Formivibrio citricus]SFN22264.1 lipid-A-disaccharide synthase [Formivibrio citricus]
MAAKLFPPGTGPKIAIVVGEASGDQLGAALIEALRVRFPDARFAGVAGPRMQSAGAVSIEPMETLAVGGIVEVVKHLPAILGVRRHLIKACLADRPDIFIGIDAPDFNLGVERRLKRAGIPAVHYVSPSVWAWRPERIKTIRAAVNHMLLLFPFEEPIYKAAGIPATCVGHPLADQFSLKPDQAGLREMLNVPPGKRVIAILPGSRQRELEALAPLFVKTAKLLFDRYPDACFLVPFVSRETRLRFEQEVWKQESQEMPWRLMFGHSHEAMQAADVVLLASGTAALECMLAHRPMVVAYKMAPMTYRMVKRKFLLPYVSLPNIIEKRFLVPEFLQDAATPENLVQALANYLNDQRLSTMLTNKFGDMHETLRCNAAERAASAVATLLGKRA